MKFLYVTTVVSTMDFFVEHIKMLQNLGHVVELATNVNITPSDEVLNLNCKIHDIKFSRNPFSIDNILSKNEFKRLIQNQKYDVVHTHTPNASIIVRLVCKKFRKKGLRVIYTTHGFHFYKGAPLKNWIIYYSLEKICSNWTDILITINKEDYELAKRKMKAKKIRYIPGIGVDLNKISSEKMANHYKKSKFNLNEDDIVFLSVGELNKNKNHISVINALGMLKEEGKINKIHYLICGQGNEKEVLEQCISNKNLEENIHLLGYRKDILSIYSIADCFVFPSFREGLSVSVMEAMANGLPIICSKIRGNIDLIDENGGYLFDPSDVNNIKNCIEQAVSCDKLQIRKMGNYNLEKVKRFDTDKVLKELYKIYFEM